MADEDILRRVLERRRRFAEMDFHERDLETHRGIGPALLRRLRNGEPIGRPEEEPSADE